MQDFLPVVIHILSIDEGKSAQVFLIEMIFSFCFGLCDLTPHKYSVWRLRFESGCAYRCGDSDGGLAPLRRVYSGAWLCICVRGLRRSRRHSLLVGNLRHNLYGEKWSI